MVGQLLQQLGQFGVAGKAAALWCQTGGAVALVGFRKEGGHGSAVGQGLHARLADGAGAHSRGRGRWGGGWRCGCCGGAAAGTGPLGQRHAGAGA